MRGYKIKKYYKKEPTCEARIKKYHKKEPACKARIKKYYKKESVCEAILQHACEPRIFSSYHKKEPACEARILAINLNYETLRYSLYLFTCISALLVCGPITAVVICGEQKT